MENKEITMDDLAVMMRDGFEKSNKRMDDGFEKAEKSTDKKIEDLAAMIKVGFDSADEKMEEVKKDIKVIREKLVVLERGQEDIKLRQDNSAYRFELKAQEETLEKHDARIGSLEEKVLIAG